MSQLAQLQSLFQAYVVGEQAGDGLLPAIINDQKVGAKVRLGVYHNAYRLRLIEVLSNTYPTLHTLLGDSLFNKSARSYIDTYPSSKPSIRWFGDQLSVHLGLTLPQHPIAAELAAFEWALGLAFDAEDTPILSLSDLATIPLDKWGDLKFRFQPSVQVLHLQWNVLSMWHALNMDEAPPPITEINGECLIWRQYLDAQFRSLEPDEHQALQLLMAGASFGDLCEHLQQSMPEDEASMTAANLLVTWLNEELISASYAP